jgi:SAM-dependent MidA family methyltransferase
VIEWGVVTSGDGFEWAPRPASTALRDVVLARSRAAQDRGLPWGVGYRGEHCPWVGPWCKSLFDSMRQGAVLLIDYGYAAPELDHPGRTRGTLCAHLQHRRLDHPEALLARVGQQDLTAHVNFSLVAQAAHTAGFRVAGFVSQARFLLNSGLLDWAQPMVNAAPDVVQKTKMLQALQTLVSESEMGEVFKVMLLTKNIPEDTVEKLIDPAFATGDRLASL